MTSALLTELLQSLSLLGGFLLIGMFLRAKLSIFQKTFIPASVLGGFILLILGPQVLDVLPASSEWFGLYSLLPGILIVPVVASVPLGLRISSGSGSDSDFLKNVLPLAAIAVAVSIVQFTVGFITQLLFKGQGLYEAFGVELGVGFSGGHGTAGTLGGVLSDLNLPYWETSQGVGITTATFGIVGGILIGIALINWGARTGVTQVLKKPADIPMPLRVGYEADVEKQASAGRETTMSSSIDTLAFHAAIIFVACGLAYVCVTQAKAFNIPILKDVSVWTYGMLVMFVIWGLICKLKLDFLVDGKVKSKISSSFTEFAVIAAIASLPIDAVLAYIVPIMVMVVLGFIVTTSLLFFSCKRLLKGYWFEQMISIFGMSTGVFLTGILLLRVCDPELESPVLANYSLAYTLSGIIYFALLNVFMVMPIESGVVMAAMSSFAVVVVAMIVAVVSSRIAFGKEYKGN